MLNKISTDFLDKLSKTENGRIGYLVLYMLGAPVGLLIFLWVILGDNLIGKG
jgi:hypothetical protein